MNWTHFWANRKNWSRFTYARNNPLVFIDPDGRRVFVVTYTTGNSHGDDEFRRAAETRADEIRRGSGFVDGLDIVVVAGIRTIEDLTSVLKSANSLGDVFGKIAELDVFSHTGQDGPTLNRATGGGVQFGPATWGKLHVEWETNSCARFFGCRSGQQFAQEFANVQKVPSYGYNGYAYFSSSPDRRVDPKPTGPLYLIDAPGWQNSGPFGHFLNKIGRAFASPMSRKEPRR